MARLWLTLLIVAEAVLLAVFGVIIAYGDLGRGGIVAVYFGVLAAVLGAAMALGLPLPWSRRVGLHGALLAGCVIFALPFVWLVGTSLKYEQEVFVYPPKWVPILPQKIDESPYVTTEGLPPTPLPADVKSDRFDALLPKIETALWTRTQALRPTGVLPGIDESRARAAMGPALYAAAERGVPADVWEGTDEKVAAAFAGRLDARMVDDAARAVYRRVGVGDVTLIDADRRPTVVKTGDWKVGGAGSVLDNGKDATAVAYHFTPDAPTATLTRDLPLPYAADQLLAVSVPIDEDRSWQTVTATLDVGGKRYASTDALNLGMDRRQEFAFKRADLDPRDERVLGYWPLSLTQQAAAEVPTGTARLTLTLHARARSGAIWSKFTDSYRRAWITSGHLGDYVFNSFYLVALNVLGQVISCSLVAYGFARLRWPGRDAVFILVLATMMLPAQVTMIPGFVVFKTLGWYNTLKALWVPAFFATPFYIFLLRQFMKALPRSLEEAALLDGCSYFGIYWRIILPLMKPALAAVAVFTFMGTWNEFMGPLIYVNDERLYPLALGLFDFRSQHGGDYGMLMAASLIMTLPVIGLFFMAQRYFIQGVSLSGIKG